MKKQPKAVYIIENGKYTELTYEEFRRREQICPLYADKLFLPLYGRLMEVSKEDYEEYYRAKRRQKYLDERSADNGDFSYDMLTTDEFSGEDILIADQPDICETIVERMMTDKLRKAILKLTDEEQLLIYRQREIPDMFYAHPAELQVIRLIKRKNVIAGVEHRFMVHTDQRIVACPGNIFHACALTYIRDQWEIVHRKYHIIMRFLYFVLNYFFKFRINIIIAKMLFDIIHRMPQQ